MVDILDFPVDPPDGEGFTARWSFGRYSSRYNGIHTGEDWVRIGGQSLGQPVNSIGHGLVTYAQPLGWGIDRGVVIVRHIFSDGSTFLSFYGHLDPASVVLRAGDCVKRGDPVGAIGQPRGRPHLHFEIRTRLPDSPGPGYWSVDPQLAGWKIPSDTIWKYRVVTSPGVQWTRPFTATDSTGIGILSDGLLAAFDDRRLMGIDPGDGSLRWSQPISFTLYRSILDVDGTAIYLSDLTGTIHALDRLGQPMWQIRLDSTTRPELMPLPGGGVVVHAARQLIGVSARGERLWQIEGVGPPFDWTLNGDELIFTTDADPPIVHRLDRSGHLIWAARAAGRPAASGDQIFIYNPTGVYRLNPEKFRTDLLVPLDPGAVETGDIVALPDGGVLVAHRGLITQRLIALNADGTLRWDRSTLGIGRAPPQLIVSGGRLYAFTAEGDVLLIGLSDGEAWRVFESGNGTRLNGENWALIMAGDRVLLDFRGGMIVAVDPQAAVEAVGGASQ